MRPGRSDLVGIAVFVVVLATGLVGAAPSAAVFTGGSASPGGMQLRAASVGTPTVAAPGPEAGANGPTAPHAAALSGVCATLGGRFADLYGGPAPPPSLAPGSDLGCGFGTDEAGLGLISNASFGGARLSLDLRLPSASSGSAGGLLAYEVRMWVAGVPCSIGGASLLSVDLVPPYGGSEPTGSGNWSVWAPVYDLVPAGGCDPRCQNATALYEVPGVGRALCEEDAVSRGPDAGTAAIGTVPPGDSLNLTFLGAVGGPAGLQVFLNDSTRPGLDLSWGYPGGVTISRDPIEPLTNRSNASSAAGWAPGPAVSVVASLCPSDDPGAVARACNSYDGPRVNASQFPLLRSAYAWNATAGAYSDPLAWGAPFSTSGGCSGAPGTAACAAFDTEGGTGSYPLWTVSGGIGSIGWTFGGTSPTTVNAAGGVAEYNDTGTLGAPVPAIGVSEIAPTASSAHLDVRAHVSAPGGIQSVALGVYFCTSSTTVPSLTSTAALESTGAENTSADGNFTSAVVFAHSESGTAYYWLNVTAVGGAVYRTPTQSVAVTGGANPCTDANPPTPTFSASNVTAVAAGYLLDFAEPDAAVTGYSLTLTETSFPFTVVPRPVPSTGPVFVPFDDRGDRFNATISATDLANRTSPASAVFEMPPVLPGLTLAATTSVGGDLWAGNASAAVNLTAAGGAAPYTFHVDFGDGGTFTGTSALPWENLTHTYVGLDGVAFVRATVTDAYGRTASAVPLGLSILAGPLGVNQSMSAGALDIHLAWTAPAAPASPVTEYTVFYTNQSAQAGTLSGLWPDNRSAEGAYLWNTTDLQFDIPTLNTGVPYYALVVAWNALGVGLLPAGWLLSPSATAQNLTPSAISVTPTGGPAPLTVDVSDTVTLGTNGTLAVGLYSFGAEGSAAANLSSNLSGPLAIWWLNASWTFPSTGTYVVLLHVTDTESDTVIPLASVYVGPAAPPSAVARITSGTPLVGDPVLFEGIAGGGTGAYSYNWTFGDGAVGSGETPSHVYAAPGNYTAVLRVTDTGDGLTTLAPVNLSVFSPPSVAIQTSATSSDGLAYQFTALESGGVGGLSFSWTFGDGATATGVVTNHTYSAPGEYNVSVTVTDSLRHSSLATIELVVPAPASTSSSIAPALTGPELAAYAVLGAIAVVLLIGLLYYWSKSREPPEEPLKERFAMERVRPPSPPDPPDPS